MSSDSARVIPVWITEEIWSLKSERTACVRAVDVRGHCSVKEKPMRAGDKVAGLVRATCLQEKNVMGSETPLEDRVVTPDTTNHSHLIQPVCRERVYLEFHTVKVALGKVNLDHWMGRSGVLCNL